MSVNRISDLAKQMQWHPLKGSEVNKLNTFFMKKNQEKMTLQRLIDRISKRNAAIDCTGLSDSGAAFLVSRLLSEIDVPLFLVTSSRKALASLEEDLQFFAPDVMNQASTFPAYNLSPYKFMAYHNETAACRIGTLFQLASAAAPQLVITSVDALLQKVIPRTKLIEFAELIMAGETCPREGLIDKLIAGGYTRTALVEEPGDFCARGMLLDVFTPGYSEPLRIEFFGDTVDTIRLFSAATQRTFEDLPEAIILPAREAVLFRQERIEVIARIRQAASKTDMPVSRVRKIVDRVKHEGRFSGSRGVVAVDLSPAEHPVRLHP